MSAFTGGHGWEGRPSVTLQLEPSVRVVRPDDDVTFRVTASADGAAVTNLCLFSNGRIRAEKAAPSALFTLPAKRLYTGENILIAMACDSKGLIGQSAPVMLEVKSSEADNHRPYRNKAQVIPGHITPGYYDEGGQGVAYFTYLKQNIFRKPAWDLTFRTDEGINAPNENGIGAFRSMWVIYTVDVEKTGATAARLPVLPIRPSRQTKEKSFSVRRQTAGGLSSARTSRQARTGGPTSSPCQAVFSPPDNVRVMFEASPSSSADDVRAGRVGTASTSGRESSRLWMID